jgi:glycerophosphoryl diester phosphodiesterase
LAAGGAEAATATTTTTAAEGRPPLVVIGHRGKGMNTLVSTDPRLRGDVRENTLRAFNDAAASHPAVAYVEFDVQVNHGHQTKRLSYSPCIWLPPIHSRIAA